MNTPLIWSAILFAEDSVPAEDDVVAGAWGAVTFVGLLIALAILGFSLTRHLRKAEDAKAAGAFGDESAPDESN